VRAERVLPGSSPSLLRGAPDPQWRVRIPARGWVLLAGAALSVGVVLLVALQVAPASRALDPMSEPLSQYAFAPDGWLFDAGVLMLAFGLAVLVTALVRRRCIPRRSGACGLLSVSSLGLVAVVVFPEHEPSGAVGTAGLIHWAAAMLTFGGLSFVPALMGGHGVAGCSRLTSLARRMCAGTGPCFVVVLAVNLASYETPMAAPAWSFALGERVLIASELALAAVLVVWAWRGCTCAVGSGAGSISTARRQESSRDGRARPPRRLAWGLEQPDQQVRDVIERCPRSWGCGA